VQIWDEEDREPAAGGELELVDAETGAVELIDFDGEARRRYAEAFDEYARELQRVALASGGRYVGLSTSLPVEEAIFGPLYQARALQ